MKNAIDLNQNQDPEMGASTSPIGGSPEPSYPEVTIHGPKAHKIPKHGVAKVKYHVVEKKSTTDKQGKTHHSARVKLHNFAPSGGLPAPSDEEALESAMQEQAEQQGGDEQSGN